MSEEPKYFDVRRDFWKENFTRALSYEDYLDASPKDKAEKWRNMEANIPALGAEDRKRLSGKDRKLNVLVSSGVWCGDCVRQGPMLKIICEGVGPDADLRFAERDDFPELARELRILGALRVPVVVFLAENFFEVGRFGDRLLTVYRRKLKQELGEACDTGLVVPPEDELVSEQKEWIDIFERMLIMERLAPVLRSGHNN